MKKVFLENLPKWGYGTNKEKINWEKSIGHKVKFIYDDIEGEVEIVNYQYSCLYIKYLDNDIFKINYRNFLKCMLGNMLNKRTNKFKVEIGQTFKDDKRNFIIIDREYRDRIDNKGNNKFYKYKCNKCGYDEGWIVESNLLNGNGCSCCDTKTVIRGINDISTTDPWMIKYFQNPDEANKYTYGSHQKIKVICPDCGRVKDKDMEIKSIYTNKSIGCSCGDGQSYPNKFMFNVLEQLKINFETEYSPEWIGLKRYDFYFESGNNKYIVEVDGGLGHGKFVYKKTRRTLDESMQDDIYKDNMAKENGIEVIRIDADKSELEFIKKNILNSKLSELYDLSTINWLKCEEFALSNRVKEACELKRNNPDYSTKYIGKIMSLSRCTIVTYLKKGSKLGWCNYTSKKDLIKNSDKYKKTNKKQVKIFKDGVCLGVFKNCSELSRQSEKLFGVRLNSTNISSCCLGNRPHHKGFTFKYVENQTNKESA